MEITANLVQNVPLHGNVIFTETAVAGNCSIMHREGSGLVKLRGLTSGQCRARFKALFTANIAIPEDGSTDESIELTLSLDGEPISATRMIVSPANVTKYFNVSSGIYVNVPEDCCMTLGVRNTSTQPILVSNANLIVERVA